MTTKLGITGSVVVLVTALLATVGPPAGSVPGDRATCDTTPFPDVAVDNPFCSEVDWLDEHDIAGGFPDGTFRPVATVSRQSMAAFLYRLRGAPRGVDPTCAAAPFPDVPTSHPFCGEVTWLADTGIAGGFPDGTYRPTATISRQFMAAFLYRMADARRGPNPTCQRTPFADVAVAHDFCGEIAWLKARGVVQGDSAGRFRPGDAVTRQAMAGFLHDLDATTGIQGGATPLDFDLDGDADLAFVHDDGGWYRAGEDEPFWAPSPAVGDPDLIVPGDYNGNGTWEPGVILDGGIWRTGGLAGDIVYPAPTVPTDPWQAEALPVPGDYDGDGDTEPAWYDTYTGTWHIQGASGPIAFGKGVDETPEDLADTPVPGDYDGDGDTDPATFSPTDNTLRILGQDPIEDLPLGLPIATDLDHDGSDEIVTFDTSAGVWRFAAGTVLDPGIDTDDFLFPLIGDFAGEGTDQLAVFVHEHGAWVGDGPLGADERALHSSLILGIDFVSRWEFIRFTWLIEECDEFGLACPPAP